MKLMTEEIDPHELDFLTEEVGGKKFHYIQGPYLRGGIVNGNGREYPVSILEREVERYTKNYIKEGRAYGELEHPPTPKVSLKNASHLIIELKQDRNDFIGKARVMDTPNGTIVQKILEAGGKLGVSSRGAGSLRENKGRYVVQDDFHLSTAADVVYDPSAPGAFVNGLMESKEWIYEAGIWSEQELEEAKRSILEANKADIEFKLINAFDNLMSKI